MTWETHPKIYSHLNLRISIIKHLRIFRICETFGSICQGIEKRLSRKVVEVRGLRGGGDFLVRESSARTTAHRPSRAASLFSPPPAPHLPPPTNLYRVLSRGLISLSWPLSSAPQRRERDKRDCPFDGSTFTYARKDITDRIPLVRFRTFQKSTAFLKRLKAPTSDILCSAFGETRTFCFRGHPHGSPVDRNWQRPLGSSAERKMGRR